MDEQSELSKRYENIDLARLEAQFRGGQYRELVQQMLREQGRRLPLSLAANLAALSPQEKEVGEPLLDKYNAMAYDQGFWYRDLAEVFREITQDFKAGCKEAGIAVSDGSAFCFFQLVTVNFADSARLQKGLRKFAGIRKGVFFR